MKKILWWASGADPEILKNIPTAQNKYSTIGIAVILTGVVAVITGIFSFQFIFNNLQTSILIGIVWGLLIFNIERILIQNSFAKSDDSSKRPFTTLIKSIPIVLVVLVLTTVISYPFILRIFSDEIDRELVNQTQTVILEIGNSYDRQMQTLQDEITKLERDLTNKENNVNELRTEYHDEVSGENGTGTVGVGPVAKIKEEAYREAYQAYQDDKTRTRKQQDDLNQRIRQIQTQKEANLTKIQQQGVHSLVAKLTALNELAKRNTTVRSVQFIVLIMMFVLNILPFLAKYISKKRFI